MFMGSAPYIEGAYMNKVNGRYYLQYAAPGTELDGYGNGVYVGNSPLGPFTYQQSNPFSHKPSGFIKAAGHGSTLQDKYGNWWHIASMKISNKFSFERRLGLFPAGFDEDGTLFCNQNYADWPMIIPEGKIDPWKTTPDWMLLSYRKKVTVSSEQIRGSGNCLTDEDIRTTWSAANIGTGEWAMVDLGSSMEVPSKLVRTVRGVNSSAYAKQLRSIASARAEITIMAMKVVVYWPPEASCRRPEMNGPMMDAGMPDRVATLKFDG